VTRAIVVLSIALSGCLSEEITFTRVQAVLDKHCFECHNADPVNVPVDLQSAGVRARLLSVMVRCWDPERAEFHEVPVLTPGIPEQSALWLKTSLHGDGNYGREMPIGGPLARIAPDDFEVLEGWILAGAPE
jgi:hypothetical protein